MPIEFSVIIVHHDSNQYLRACLRSIAPAAGNLGFETIVVDNASVTLEDLPLQFPKTHWIKNQENLGWGKAVNQAFLHARGEILILLNPDAELMPKSLVLTRLFFAEKDRGDMGPVGGRLLFSNGEVQPSCGPFPHLANLLWRLPMPPPRRRCYLRQFNQPTRVDWVSGAFMAIRHSIFHELGGMDARFFLYYEDVDFCLRASRRSLATYYLPQAVAFHHNPHALRRNVVPELKQIIQSSRFLYFKKHRPAWESWALSQLHRLEKVT